MFQEYAGYMMNLTITKKSKIFIWAHKGCKILFSVSRYGDAAVCHLASDKKGLKFLKHAIEGWCEYVFETFDWCKLILAPVEKPSVYRILLKLDFRLVSHKNNNWLLARSKSWAV